MVDVVMNAGWIHARAMLSETEPAPDGVAFLTSAGADRSQTNYGAEVTVMVNAGQASVRASLDAAVATVPLTVTAAKTEDIDVVLGAGKLVLRGKRSTDAAGLDDGITWTVSSTAGDAHTIYGGETRLSLPAGDYTVKAELGEAVVEVPVSLSAGQTLTKDIVVATGTVVAHALFAEGGPTVTQGATFQMLAAAPGPDGKLQILATAYNDGASFNLPPGKYILRAQAPTSPRRMPGSR